MNLSGLPGTLDYAAGYRVYKWIDPSRERPVWADVWYPAHQDQRRISYGLGDGFVAQDAEVAQGGPFPLVVTSHGAFGSALNYGWLSEYLARQGVIVLGVSHYRESWRYGPDAVHPMDYWQGL